MSRFVVLSIATMAIAAVPATSVAGEEYEEVVFRVTLEGPVDPAHTFAVERQCAEEICVTGRIVIVCSPPNSDYDWPTCAATTYEFTSMIRAGLSVEYALLRWTTPGDLRHAGDQPEEHLPGSWTVRDGRQAISLGYVYPGGTQSGSGDGQVLPDTALPAPGERESQWRKRLEQGGSLHEDTY